MTSENVQKGTWKMDNTGRDLLLTFFVKLSNISSLGDGGGGWGAEKVSFLYFPKLSELIMCIVRMSTDEDFYFFLKFDAHWYLTNLHNDMLHQYYLLYFLVSVQGKENTNEESISIQQDMNEIVITGL